MINLTERSKNILLLLLHREMARDPEKSGWKIDDRAVTVKELEKLYGLISRSK